ncbi:MAG: oligosaccharide repeat unit polymerase [Chloroflexia bacterium]|nr:oligosaccharide repeat unit polymerase [Chloroflexia bacterium]
MKGIKIIFVPIYLVSLFISIIVLVYLYYSNRIFDPSLLQYGFVLLFIFTPLYLFLSQNNKVQYFRFSLLFLLGFLIVHFQLYLDYLIGNHTLAIIEMFKINSVGMQGFYLALVATFVFYFGYVTFQYIKKKNARRKSVNSKYYRVFFLKAILIALFLTYFSTSNFTYFKGNYGKVPNTSIASYIEYFLILTIVAYIIVVSINLKENYIKKKLSVYLKAFDYKILIIIAIYLFSVISSGDRGSIFLIAMSLFLGYIYASNKIIPVFYIVITGIVGILFLFIIGISREIRGTSNMSIQKLQTAKKIASITKGYQSISPYTYELSRSLRAYHGSILYVNDNGLRYGLVNLYQISGVIPGLGRLFKIIASKSEWELVSSKIITEYLHGYKASHGLGTTTISDIYMDFGLPGIIIIFLLFGIFVRLIDENLNSKTHLKLINICFLFGFTIYAVYIGRASMAGIFRHSIVIYLIILISQIPYKLKTK